MLYVKTLLNTLFLGACAALIWLGYHDGPKSGGVSHAPYRIGDAVRISGVDPSRSARTLLIYVAAGRTARWEFYQTLFAVPRRPAVLRVIVLTDDSSTTTKQFIDHGLRADAIIRVPIAQTKIREVPTLLLIDSAGILQAVWRGSPDVPSQRQILALAASQ